MKLELEEKSEDTNSSLFFHFFTTFFLYSISCQEEKVFKLKSTQGKESDEVFLK